MDSATVVDDYIVPFVERKLESYSHIFDTYIHSTHYNSYQAITLLFLLHKQSKYRFSSQQVQSRLAILFAHLSSVLRLRLHQQPQKVALNSIEKQIFDYCTSTSLKPDLSTFDLYISHANSLLSPPTAAQINNGTRFYHITKALFDAWFQSQQFISSPHVQHQFSSTISKARQYVKQTVHVLRQRAIGKIKKQMLVCLAYLITHVMYYQFNYHVYSATQQSDDCTFVFDFCQSFVPALMTFETGHVDCIFELASLLRHSKLQAERTYGLQLLADAMAVVIQIECRIEKHGKTFAPDTHYCVEYMQLHFVHAALFCCAQ